MRLTADQAGTPFTSSITRTGSATVSQANVIPNGPAGGESLTNNPIVAAEYFVNTDPGEGSGTTFTPEDGTFDSEVEGILDKVIEVSALAGGTH